MRHTLKYETSSSKNNHEHIKRFIKETMDSVNYIGFPRIFVNITGDVKAALFLNQCVYWSDKGKRRDGYIYKSDKDFAMETGLSLAEIKRIKPKLEELGFIRTKVKKANGAPTTHYYVGIPMIEQAINQYHQNHQKDRAESIHSDLVKSDKSITEITQKNTPQSTTDVFSSVSYTNKESLMEFHNDEKYSYGIDKHNLNGCLEDDISKMEKEIMNISGESSLSYDDQERIKRISELIYHGRKDDSEMDEDLTRRENMYEIKYIDDKLRWAYNIYLTEGRRLKTSQILTSIEKPENQEKWRKYVHNKENNKGISKPTLHPIRQRMRMVGEVGMEESDY